MNNVVSYDDLPEYASAGEKVLPDDYTTGVVGGKVLAAQKWNYLLNRLTKNNVKTQEALNGILLEMKNLIEGFSDSVNPANSSQVLNNIKKIFTESGFTFSALKNFDAIHSTDHIQSSSTDEATDASTGSFRAPNGSVSCGKNMYSGGTGKFVKGIFTTASSIPSSSAPTNFNKICQNIVTLTGLNLDSNDSLQLIIQSFGTGGSITYPQNVVKRLLSVTGILYNNSMTEAVMIGGKTSNDGLVAAIVSHVHTYHDDIGDADTSVASLLSSFTTANTDTNTPAGFGKVEIIDIGSSTYRVIINFYRTLGSFIDSSSYNNCTIKLFINYFYD